MFFVFANKDKPFFFQKLALFGQLMQEIVQKHIRTAIRPPRSRKSGRKALPHPSGRPLPRAVVPSDKKRGSSEQKPSFFRTRRKHGSAPKENDRTVPTFIERYARNRRPQAVCSVSARQTALTNWKQKVSLQSTNASNEKQSATKVNKTSHHPPTPLTFCFSQTPFGCDFSAQSSPRTQIQAGKRDKATPLPDIPQLLVPLHRIPKKI